jgi:FG-GAP-like repeat
MRRNSVVFWVATLIAASQSPSQTLSFKRTDYPVGKSPAGIATGDFNKDGRPDLVVANFSGSSISVLLGKKDGTFQTATAIPTAVSPLAVVVADFNRDVHGR